MDGCANIFIDMVEYKNTALTRPNRKGFCPPFAEVIRQRFAGEKPGICPDSKKKAGDCEKFLGKSLKLQMGVDNRCFNMVNYYYDKVREEPSR